MNKPIIPSQQDPDHTYRLKGGNLAFCKNCHPNHPCRWHGGKYRFRSDIT